MVIPAIPPTAPPSPDGEGLDPAEARRRLARDGPNALPEPPRRGPWRVLGEVLREPMFLLLVVAALVYAAIGDLAEGALLGAFALLTVGLTVVQELRSERALEALRSLAAPRARVLRAGEALEIPAREVVRGDLLLVGEGERVAADARLRRAEGLEVDESLLTGESVPVVKRAGDAGDAGCIRAGTLVVGGHGVAEVVATGAASEAGRIGASLATIEGGDSPLRRSLVATVRLLGVLAIVLSIAVALLYGNARGDWIAGALAGIALAMAMLPEEIPMVLLVFLALGAWRLARVRVLARRIAAVETLGAADILCVDKTGTLTENRMRMRVLALADGRRLDLRGDEAELPEAFHRLLEHAVLASKRRAIDPMDRAVDELARGTLAGTGHLHATWALEREYGLSPVLPALSRVWRDDDGALRVAAKGAPEAVASLCGLGPAERAALAAEVEALAVRGLRVLAVAVGKVADEPLPDAATGLPFRLEGLLGFADPLRADAAAAVAEARAAGIEVAMITGDHPATARAIAAEAGIDLAGGVLSGADLDALDDAALDRALVRTRVFARIRPQQKLRLVERLKAAGRVVAMTGDGVNDAPALKAAHIGLAMGRRGTDVAREAADIVLLDDAFGDLVHGIRAGRRVFDNLRKVMRYIVAIHVPVAGLALLPLLFGLPPMLLPMHVVLVEMVVDPVCSVAFESTPAERDLMRRPPRDPGERLLGPAQIAIGLLQGGLLLAACFAVYAVALARGVGEDESRTLAFVALTVGNLGLVRINQSHGSALSRLAAPGYRAFWIVAAVALAIVAACIAWPAAAALFGFVPPAPAGLAAATAVGLGVVVLLDLSKRVAVVQRVLAERSARPRASA